MYRSYLMMLTDGELDQAPEDCGLQGAALEYYKMISPEETRNMIRLLLEYAEDLAPAERDSLKELLE